MLNLLIEMRKEGINLMETNPFQYRRSKHGSPEEQKTEPDHNNSASARLGPSEVKRDS